MITPENLLVIPEEEIKELVPNYLKNRLAELPKLTEAVKNRDYVTVKSITHNWKGNSRPFGFVYLEGLSRSLEQAAKDANETQADKLIIEVVFYLQNVKIQE